MGSSSDNIQNLGSNEKPPSAQVQIGNTSTTLDVVQNLFKEFTAKSSRYTKLYSDSLIITAEDIKSLHCSIIEAFQVFHIDVATLYAQIYYANGKNIRHSSVQELCDSSSTQNNETESVLLQYNFLMKIPNTLNVQKCELSIRLLSRISLEKKIRADFGSTPPHFLISMGGRPVMVEIDYVNIIVETSLASAVDKWVESIDKSKTPTFMPLLKSNSHWIPIILSRLSAIFSTICCLWYYYDDGRTPQTTGELAEWMTFTFIVTLTSYTISRGFGQYIEYKIDSWSPLSYISITKSDKIAARSREKSQRSGAIYSVLSFFSSLPSAVVVKFLVEQLLRVIK